MGILPDVSLIPMIPLYLIHSHHKLTSGGIKVKIVGKKLNSPNFMTY